MISLVIDQSQPVVFYLKKNDEFHETRGLLPSKNDEFHETEGSFTFKNDEFHENAHFL